MEKIYRYETEKKPRAQIESRLSHDGNYYIVDTPHELKGRGIFERAVVWRKDTYRWWHDWKSYRVTKKAYAVLCEKYEVAQEICFD